MRPKRKPAAMSKKSKETVNKKLIYGIAGGLLLIVIAMTVLLILQ
jgi:hypothetical protein